MLLLHLLVELQLRAQALPELTALPLACLLDLLETCLGLFVLLFQELNGVHTAPQCDDVFRRLSMASQVTQSIAILIPFRSGLGGLSATTRLPGLLNEKR
jgi:hypothetical protein